MLGSGLRLVRRRIRRVARDVTNTVAGRSALILAPHPDDETIGCGAVILRKMAAGTPVTVVVVADGRYTPRSEYMPPEGVAVLRRAEMVEAGRRLGLPAQSIRLWGYEDCALPYHEADLVGRISELIAELKPDEVYVTGAFESHADHSALGRATRRALEGMDRPPVLMEYPIWIWHQLYDGAVAAPRRARLATARAAIDLLAQRRRPVKVRSAQFAAGKWHALEGYESQLGIPTGVPDEEHWHTLPQPVLDNARDSVELFLPWRPRKATRRSA